MRHLEAVAQIDSLRGCLILEAAILAISDGATNWFRELPESKGFR
jgi:hypothetical protein